MNSSPNLELLRWKHGDEQAILQLFQESFGRDLGLPAWRWRFQDAPAGAGVIVLGWNGSRLAAHYAVTAIELCVSGGHVASGLSGTTMTHPSYRGGGLFPRLAEATYEEMSSRGKEIVWGFPNHLSHRGFVQDLSWKDIYEIPTFRAHIPLRRPIPASPTVTEVKGPDASFDRLWMDVRARHRVIARRDCAALTWRYRNNPSETYRFLVSRFEEELQGYAVLKRYKHELHIIDMLARSEESELGLIHAALALAAQESFASVSLWLGPHRPIHPELERLGFVNEAPVTYFGARILGPRLDASTIENYKSWYVAMGDSDVY